MPHPLNYKSIGILGGKGPEATADLFQKIIRATPATREEEHLRIYVDNHPQIPKPALAIRGEGPDPVPAMIESARKLEQMGAEILVIPCNSAHYYLEPVQRTVSVPFLSILDTAVAAVQAADCGKILVLGSLGLLESALYQDALTAAGVENTVPNADGRKRLMDAILQYKDTARIEALDACVADLLANADTDNCGGALLGCTELPLVAKPPRDGFQLFDASEILAQAVVKAAVQ